MPSLFDLADPARHGEHQDELEEMSGEREGLSLGEKVDQIRKQERLQAIARMWDLYQHPGISIKALTDESINQTTLHTNAERN